MKISINISNCDLHKVRISFQKNNVCFPITSSYATGYTYSLLLSNNNSIFFLPNKVDIRSKQHFDKFLGNFQSFSLFLFYLDFLEILGFGIGI